jgi:hypothetical protein
VITTILHLAACLSLAGASIYWMVRRPGRPGVHRFLFPFIIVSGTAGIVLTISPLLEIWVAYYGGAIYEIEAFKFRYAGPYWWIYSSLLAFPLFPLLGILPFIGRQPLLMAGICIISVSPSLFLLWAPALFSFFR